MPKLHSGFRARCEADRRGMIGDIKGGLWGCGGWGTQGCTCMRSVLAIRGIYLSKALTKEPIHG